MPDELLRNPGSTLGEFLVDGRSGGGDGCRDFLTAAGELLRHSHAGMAKRLGSFFACGSDLPGHLAANASQRFAHALAIIGKSLTLAREFADQVPDPVLIFGVRALQRSHLVVNQRFQFTGSSECA